MTGTASQLNGCPGDRFYMPVVTVIARLMVETQQSKPSPRQSRDNV